MFLLFFNVTSLTLNLLLKMANYCGVCKSNTAVKRVQCENCKIFYHNACVNKLKNVIHINSDLILCCNITYASQPSSDESEPIEKILAEQQSCEMEVRYLKMLLKEKDDLINELKSKNQLLEKVLELVTPTSSKKLSKPIDRTSEQKEKGSAHIPTTKPPQVQKPMLKDGTADKSTHKKTDANITFAEMAGSNHNLKTNNENLISHKYNLKTTKENFTLNEDKETLNNKENTSNVPKQKRKFIRGINEDTTTLAAVESRKWIFVSNLKPEVTESDVVNHLKAINKSTLLCQKLTIKNQDIAAFKIAVKAEEYDSFLDEEIWPVNCVVKPYRNFWKVPRPTQTK